MKLDMRLRMVAGLIRPGIPLADIGTDHAYLPVFLVENDIIPKALASDVKIGPLENAKKTINKHNLSDKITPVLSDGLKEIPHEYTDFCIAGMGGELIAKILEESPWVRRQGNHFVFQPQTHPEDLRRHLLTNGYEIVREDVVKERMKYYLAIEAVCTGVTEEHREADYYIGKLRETTSIHKGKYLEKVASRLDVKLKATRDEKYGKLIDEILEAAK
ncbi:MAG: SAM-dependent methyltransferase [Clostridia bacterium]|nr:SAM-dependent methyltransferase [Clostridia bacterium]